MSTPDPPPWSGAGWSGFGDPQVVAVSVHEPAAFAEIYARHADDVHRYLRRRLGSDVADDLTADTFVAAFGARARFDQAAPSAQAMNRELATALSELSAGDRDVLLLVAWAELSYAEVAAALQLPVGTVRSRLNRARRKVRTTLSPGTERVAIRPLTAIETRGGHHG